MTDTEKEVYIENLKRQVRNRYTPDVADELCNRLDIAKKEADVLEQMYNQQLQSINQLIKLL